MSIPKLIAGCFVLLCLAACARTYQARYVEPSGFLTDYTMLKEGGENDALLTYWKNKINWRKYKKIIIKPVVVKKLPSSELNELTHAEIFHLKDLLEYRVQEALKTRFLLVNKSGPDTLMIEMAITDVETSVVLLDMFSSVYPSARTLSALKHLVTGTESFVGKASLESKVVDSETGELLMAFADARAGGKTLIGSTSEWDDIEQAYKYWAVQVSYQLCQKQQGTNCIKPVSE